MPYVKLLWEAVISDGRYLSNRVRLRQTNAPAQIALSPIPGRKHAVEDKLARGNVSSLRDSYLAPT